MSIRLRGHHLLCMLTYVGEGYNDAFVENFTALCLRMAQGETITVVNGPDDVCAPLLCSTASDNNDAHCTGLSCMQRDEFALNDIAQLIGQPLAVGDSLHCTAPVLQRLRKAFAQGIIRRACRGCEWYDLCTRVASAETFGQKRRASKPGIGRESNLALVFKE